MISLDSFSNQYDADILPFWKSNTLAQLGQHSLRRLTKVNATGVIRLPPIGKRSMWKSSQFFGNTVVRKQENTLVCLMLAAA